jgi:glycosyltransferase involved in cell wall biosynthesis
MEKPLRILAVVNLPWDARLGAVRVWIELTEEWRKAGHSVEKFCLTDAYPKPTSSHGLSALRQMFFPYRAASYVRRHADRFDVIDCLIGTLPFSKKYLRFDGLLVARSVGLYRSYERFLQLTKERWPNQPRGRVIGRFFYKFTSKHLRESSARAIRHCDLLNLPNEEELQFVQEISPAKRTIVKPYGLNDRVRTTLARAIQPAELRLAKKEIVFIGAWSLRKGARDWPDLIREVRREIPEAQFSFLGTMSDAANVYDELQLSPADGVRCISTYDPADLPELLGPSAVGLFPSYVEGFGFGVLEQIACGIPTVAYDVPGPRQILKLQREMLLTPDGDVKAMAARAVQILRMSVGEYSELSKKCRSMANQFRWEQIASDTVRQYSEALAARTAESNII